MLTDKDGKPKGGTLFTEDKAWLLKKADYLIACKTFRREATHAGNTTLTVKCTTYDCTSLNDIITKALVLIDENAEDKSKEAVFQRLQEEGKKSLLHEDDASGQHAPEADGSATAAPPPAPAGAAAAACDVKHQPNCMACDLFNAFGGGTRSPCPACGAIAAPPALAAPPAPQPPAPAAPATPVPHEDPGFLKKLFNRLMCTPPSSTVCAPKSDGNGAPVCTQGIAGGAGLQGGQESPREEQQQQNGSPSFLQYLLPINAQQYLPRAVQGSTTMLPWKTKEADGSATAAARPERAASSGPPPPSPATPVGDQASAPVTPKDDDWASQGCEPVEVFSADLRQERNSALPNTGSLTPGIPPGLALTAIPTPPASSMDPTEFPSPLGFPVQLQLADAIPESNFFPSGGWEFSFDAFESYAFSFDAFEYSYNASDGASDTTVDGLSA